MWLDAETFLYYQASELVPFKISSFLSSAVIKKLANPGLFLCKFLVFSNTNFTYKKLQWALNSDSNSIRRVRWPHEYHHGTSSLKLSKYCFCLGPSNYLSCCSCSGHFVNLLLGYTSGLNLGADLGPVLALFLFKKYCHPWEYCLPSERKSWLTGRMMIIGSANIALKCLRNTQWCSIQKRIFSPENVCFQNSFLFVFQMISTKFVWLWFQLKWRKV